MSVFELFLLESTLIVLGLPFGLCELSLYHNLLLGRCQAHKTLNCGHTVREQGHLVLAITRTAIISFSGKFGLIETLSVLSLLFLPVLRL